MSFRTKLAARLITLSALYSLILFPLLPLTVYAQGAAANHYTPTPAPRVSDPTLEPIAADEPVPPAAFPPIPDRLDLSNAIATTPAPAASGVAAGSPASIRPTYHQGYGHVPAGAYMQQGQQPAYHQGYGHTPAGAYAQPRQAPPGQSQVSNESFNANSGSQARPHLPELPTPVTVSQSTTQDLSLPDDEFSNYHKKRHSNVAGSMMRGLMYGAAGMGFGMGMGMGMGSLRY